MRSTKNNFLFLFLIIGLIFPSCSKDDALTNLDNELVSDTIDPSDNEALVANIDNNLVQQWTYSRFD
ncbi:MAG: hypothetical protein AB8H03_13675 [Saprospiraceae bacterium]